MKALLLSIISFLVCFMLNAQDIMFIDITKAKYGEIPADRIFSEIKYVPLETHKDGLFYAGINPSYYLTEKYIIATDVKCQAYLFDRETGAFIREISSRGQGPNEYIGGFVRVYGYDEKNKILFERGNSISWKCFNIETNKVEYTIKKPVPENNDVFYTDACPWLIKDSIYVSFVNNKTGKDKVKLIVYDREGSIIKKYPNYLEYKRTEFNFTTSNPGIFYYFNKQTYFKEWSFNDTVFRVNDKDITSHIIFKLGNKQPSYYNRQDPPNYNKGKYFITFVYESNSFVLFNFSHTSGMHTGYYDKKNKQVYISTTNDLKKSGYLAVGLPVNFCPIFVNSNNEMIAHINPEELVKNKDKIDSKYKHLFQNLQEEDNPIVIIAKLK